MKMSGMIQKGAATVVMALMFAQTSMAAIASAQDHSAEIAVLESLIGLQGQKLSKAQAQSEARSAIEQYYASSADEGRIERMTAAMVEMGVASQDQVEAMQASLVAKAKAAQAEGKEISSAELAAMVKDVVSHEQSGSAFNPLPIFDGMWILGLTLVAGDLIGGQFLSGPMHGVLQRTEAVLLVGGLVGTCSIVCN